LTKAPTSLLEYAVYISARNKLIDAMSLDIDRPINRAMVVGCAVSATPNYLKLHVSRTLKVLWRNTHAETRKLWKRSAGLPPLGAYPSFQSYWPSPAEMPTALSSVPRYADIARRLMLASRLTIESSAGVKSS
jgi:hypothetical protein